LVLFFEKSKQVARGHVDAVASGVVFHRIMENEANVFRHGELRRVRQCVKTNLDCPEVHGFGDNRKVVRKTECDWINSGIKDSLAVERRVCHET
jgi:hypothetical protein